MKLTALEQVEKRVGKPVGPRDLKVIDYVDEHAERWLSHVHFGFLAFGNQDRLELTLAGGQAGFASVVDQTTVRMPVVSLDDASLCEEGFSFGALFMVSGMDETLRLNGVVLKKSDDSILLRVQECYLHCAKSLRRSEFWTPTGPAEAAGDVAGFIGQARFMVLASMNSSGQADVSPKGDPAGLLLQQQGDGICFADRPGNRRIDSFRNIIEQPRVSLMAFIPGSKGVLCFNGEAEILADERLADRFQVQGKTPHLVTRVMPESVRVTSSQAIAAAALWPAKAGPNDLVPSEIFKAHVKNSKESSLQAKVARAAVSLPGAMEKGLEMDYKKNMY